MNICMRNTEEKQSKTQKQWTSTSWVKHKLGENNREKYSWWKRMFLSFSFKKKQINYISAQLPNSTLNSHLLQGRESVIEREAWGLWCQEHIDACLCNHRNLWMESTGSQVWTAAVIAGKRKKPGDFVCVTCTQVTKASKTEFEGAHMSLRTHFNWVIPAITYLQWGNPSCCFLPRNVPWCLPQSWLMPDLTQHGQQQKHSQPILQMWLRKWKRLNE